MIEGGRTTFFSVLLCAAASASGDGGHLYKAGAGPLPTIVADRVEIDIPERGRQLMLRISYPDSGDRFPLIVFFHGALCPADGYAALADHWASHGYVTILPDHPAAESQGRPDPDEQYKTFLEQTRDMSSVLDALESIGTEIEASKTLIDPTRVAAAGHSMGALIATIVAGLPRLEEDGSHLSLRDERFDVAVLLSGPGPLSRTPEGGWESVDLPLLATTGTRDHANRGGDGATWEWRLGTYELTPAGDKFGLVIDEADHFLGGMICAERADGPPDEEAFMIVKGVSTAFLDAYLKQDEAAAKALSDRAISEMTNGRATLLTR